MEHDIKSREDKLKDAGLALKALRGSAGVTDTARGIGICHSALCKYENGKLMPKQPTINKITAYFKTTQGKIWGDLKPVNMSEVMKRAAPRTKKTGDTHPEAAGTRNGNQYKIGRHGFVYYLNGRDWVKSSISPKDFEKHVKKYA